MPSILKFTEYSASCVNIPARIGGMPSNVFNTPVTRPATHPAMNESKSATYTFIPFIIVITKTAPPVASVPSTVKSAKSSTLKVI